MRIVSLNCSNTEIVHALGCADLLVGIDSDSDWPEQVVKNLPRVGRDLDIDVQKVAALAPDLVLASVTVPGHEKVIAALAEAGLPYLAPETESLPDVYTDIQTIADHLGVPERGRVLIGKMQQEIGSWSVDAAQSAPSILVQWWPKPVIAPGRRSWVHDLLHKVGAVNPLGARDLKSTPLADDEVVGIAPDLVVLSWCGVKPAQYRKDVVYRNPTWQQMSFVREQRVHIVPEAWLGRPGPRLIEGAKALRALVQDWGRDRAL